MADEIALTVANVRPLQGAKVRRGIAAAALAFGDAVYVSSYSGDLPKVDKCDGAAIAYALNPFGIVISTDNPGATSIALGDNVDVVVFGPVAGFTGMTSGAVVFVSDTVGRISHVAGTKQGVVGQAESPTVLFVLPGLFNIST